MTASTALFMMIILYGVLPVAGIYLGYRGFKKLTRPKVLAYKAMPKLGYIPEKSLPTEIVQKLDMLNDKGEKLKLLYGDSNNDGIIDDKDAVTESYIMINNLMNKHIPQAVADYRRLQELGGDTVDITTIKNSSMTGHQVLLEVLNTVDAQFDQLLEAAYHQDGQKLLATQRYLQQRFDQ